MQARVICMASPKGGSGKTVLTATFGAFLAALGKKVLLIDTDASTNGLTLLHLKEVMTNSEFVLSEGREPRGAYELDGEDPRPDVVVLPSGAHLIPASYKFTNTEAKSLDLYTDSLRRALQLLRDSYQYIFLDAQAGSDLFAEVAMSRHISDEVVIVSEYDPMSAAGVERLKGLFREDLTYVRTWVLLNKMLPEFVQSFSDFLEVAKYLPPVPWDADVVRAYARRKLALNLETPNEFTLAIRNTIEVLFGDELKEDIRDWASARQSAIRQPLEEKYRDAERELRGLMLEARRQETSRLRPMVVATVGAAIATAAGIIPFLLDSPSRDKLTATFLPVLFAVLSLPIVLVLFRDRFLRLFGNEDFESDKARLERQRELVEERLKKLEALRHADLEVLLKQKM